jgi:hypothetical protein
VIMGVEFVILPLTGRKRATTVKGEPEALAENVWK